jgi:hypothetical protein
MCDVLEQPQMVDERNGEFDRFRIGREIEVLCKNMSQCLFIHHKSHMN